MTQIRGLESTDLFVGGQRRPLQLVRVTFAAGGALPLSDPARVRVEGPGVTTPEPTTVAEATGGTEQTVEVAVEVGGTPSEGTARRVTVLVDTADARASTEADLTVAAPGWTMFMIPHFHYDPVWWNTQAAFTAAWYDVGTHAADPRGPARTAFDLVHAHVSKALDDSDYKFVLAELDYLKPFWDTRPEQRAVLRELAAQGRLEIVGGTYNEPNTNLTTPESTIRSAVYGIGYQRDVLGAGPRTAWMLDAFGHDPAFPGLMAQAGLTSSAWARGPFHQWGPKLTVGDNTRMQFPSEFEWVAPDGTGLLTSYMPNHYIAGWDLHVMPDLARAEEHAYLLFRELKPVAATHNVLLPVGADHVIPSRWATEVQRSWNARYTWPRFVVGLPGEFFTAVRAEAGSGGGRTTIALRPQSRDMNPVYTGKEVSYIDTKQAQRAAEVAVVDGEKLATLAALLGARFPAEALDKAWRQICFGAHHDGITGTESDQVYLDLLGSWREAHELGAAVGEAAIDHIATRVDTGDGREAGQDVLVVNTLSWPRTDLARHTLDYPQAGTYGLEIRDELGEPVAATTEAARTHADGSLAEVTVCFVAHDVPATGYRTFRVVPAATPPPGWTTCETGQEAGDEPGGAGTSPATGNPAIGNPAFRVEADPARGGALARVRDERTGTEVLRGPGNELAVYDEYAEHPDFGEGPWHLLPTGAAPQRSTQAAATVTAQACPVGQRLVTTYTLAGLRVRQEVTLWHGIERVDFRTHLDGSLGSDRLLRVRFPTSVQGGRPVYEVGNAAVGRGFGFPDVDTGRTPWTLDNPALRWCAVSSTARVALTDGGVPRIRHTIGVAEVVAAAGTGDGELRNLVAALAARGVTATSTQPRGPRYGASDVDSNLPDVRISVGGPEHNSFTAEVLAAADPAYRRRLEGELARHGRTRVWVPAARGRAATWVPGADVRGARDLPVLIVAGAAGETDAALAGLARDLGDATIDVEQPAELDGASEPWDDYTVALVNRGTPGCVVDAAGTLHMSLLRACSGWPSGVWIDQPRRTTPDGSSFAWQHWSHTFGYSLVAAAGDWRAARLVHHGHAVNHPLLVRAVPPAALPDEEETGGRVLPSAASLMEVEPDTVVLGALKPHGNPLASGRRGDVDPHAGITVRCYEAHGHPVRATVRCWWHLTTAYSTDLLERPTGEVGVASGALALHLDPAGTVTATAVPRAVPTGREPLVAGATELGPVHEPAQPVFTRYWLHNKGPAPMGNLAVSVHAEPVRLPLEPEGTATVTVTVASSASHGQSGQLELAVPPGLEASPAGPIPFHLAPGGHTELAVAVRAAGDLAGGRYLLAARLYDVCGQALEDVVTLTVGGTAAAAGVDARLLTPEVCLAPGDTGEVAVRLTSGYRSPVRGEAQLLSPFGTWEMLTPWSQGFTLAAGARTTLRYGVRVPTAALPGSYWALVKVMHAGHVAYTPAMPVEVAGGRVPPE